MRHTTIDLGPDDTVEVVLEPCPCAPGHVCPDGDPFASVCPRRGARPPAPRDGQTANERGIAAVNRIAEW